ncbi:hypothetical protein DES39_0416 [Orbus hercynius]|uniref:Uncharacterized protein n=1 Tax=Orbus hercynius TaxID=593135 RepID=A0A495RI57_9GAMM|nr:hypothetical protein [Orbus hercynius]RKS87197.1 hypothetical protein DES39_0416 [Orbus hercynius]
MEITISSINVKLCCFLSLSLTSLIAGAGLSVETVKIIVGNQPSLSQSAEDAIDDLDLLGFTLTEIYQGTKTETNYYGSDAQNLPIKPAYPFKALFKIAPIKQPSDANFYDLDGDNFPALTEQTALTMQWYYTSNTGVPVAFTPTNSDTFCNLTSANKVGPYLLTISGNLILASRYGVPNTNEYPNETITLTPSKTYTILADAGICYAQPNLIPNSSLYTGEQWSAKNGFLTQSDSHGETNFPRTAFYNAHFSLMLAKKGLVNNYNWEIKKGADLITILPQKDNIVVTFNGSLASNTAAARSLVVNSNGGYDVLITGTHNTSGAIIKYPFKVANWYSGWNGSTAPNSAFAARVSWNNVAAACSALLPVGGYRLPYDDEASNAALGTGANPQAFFTREISKMIFSEWGKIDASSYPDTFGFNANTARRFWVINKANNDICDIHLYNQKYHCRDVNETKNAVCIATP